MKKALLVFSVAVAVIGTFSSCKKIALEKTVTYTIFVKDTSSVGFLRFTVTPTTSFLWDFKTIPRVELYNRAPLIDASNQALPGDDKIKDVYLVPLSNRVGPLYGHDYTIAAAADSLKKAPGGPYRFASARDFEALLRKYIPVLLLQSHSIGVVTTLKATTPQNGDSTIGVLYAGNPTGPTKVITLSAGYSQAGLLPGTEVLVVKQ